MITFWHIPYNIGRDPQKAEQESLFKMRFAPFSIIHTFSSKYQCEAGEHKNFSPKKINTESHQCGNAVKLCDITALLS